MEANQLSREAHARLQAEYDDLTTRGRIEVADKIERARELGDLSENGDYHAAKDEQGHMEGRIRQLEHLLDTAEIIEPSCGACINAGPGVSYDKKTVTVSAINRNFPGRSGPGQLYLASPYTTAASALAGRIAAWEPEGAIA